MCKECGCGNGGNKHLQFTAKGYTRESAKSVEKNLLGLSGVLSVYVNGNSGETTIDYNPAKTKLKEILSVFDSHGVEAAINTTNEIFQRRLSWPGRVHKARVFRPAERTPSPEAF